jgi:hypothetical protein
LVLEQTNSKNKTIRAAALEAVAEHDRPEVVKLFIELIKAKTLDLLARPLRLVRNRQVLDSLIEEGKRAFDLLLENDVEQIPRYWEILDCLQLQKNAEKEQFLLTCFDQCEKLAKLKAAKNSHVAGSDLVARLAALLHSIGSPPALEAVLARREILPPTAFGQVLRSALRTWPAAKIYEEFAPLLGQKKGVGKTRRDELQRTIWAACDDNVLDFVAFDGAELDASEAQILKKLEWDSRWLDAAIKADQQEIVCCLARPGHKGAVTYLLKLLGAKSQPQMGQIIQALARCQYPKLTDVFVELIRKKAKGAQYLDWELQQLFESARYLPATDLPKLDAFAAKLDEKFVDKFLEALEPLRRPNQLQNHRQKNLVTEK